MMRWWNSDALLKKKSDSVEALEIKREKLMEKEESEASDESEGLRKWTFRVRVDTNQGETVAVTGNCRPLGFWQTDQAFVLTKEKDDGNENVWRGTCKIPLNREVEYRYAIMIIVEPDGHKITKRHFIVKRWETNWMPRNIPKYRKWGETKKPTSHSSASSSTGGSPNSVRASFANNKEPQIPKNHFVTNENSRNSIKGKTNGNLERDSGDNGDADDAMSYDPRDFEMKRCHCCKRFLTESDCPVNGERDRGLSIGENDKISEWCLCEKDNQSYGTSTETLLELDAYMNPIEDDSKNHRKSRLVSELTDKEILEIDLTPPEPEPEIMGCYDNKERMDRGWLTSETAIQLKLFNSNLQVWKTKLKGQPIYVKVAPINLSRTSISQEMQGDECLSLETMDLSEKSDNFPVVEVAVLNQRERHFKLQEQFGRAFCEDDFMIFQVLLLNQENMAMLMDFYAFPHGEEEPPYHVGFSHILPNAMKNSEGQVVVPITSARHRPVGEVTVEYLVIKPTANIPTPFNCDLSYSLHRQWKDSWRGLDVGHRGGGASFKPDIKQCAEVRENTIASLKTAASHGADFVEFDVQLSRDLVPVLYHDFYVAIALKRKKQLVAEEMIQLPVKDLSLEQLQRLKDIRNETRPSKVLHFTEPDVDESLYHVGEPTTSTTFSDEHLEEHQPFPTLKQALEILDQCVGFNIEIKWTMQLKDGTYELYHPFDLNLYLDTVLEVVLRYAGKRSIVFSCFHPDICSMIRLKQNRFPVMFLTQGITDKYPAYHDPRCLNVPIAVHFAVNMDILGINVHTEDLLRDSSQVDLVKRAGLVLFCWGDDNNDVATIKHLKDLGIHAVIYDKIDEYGNKEESIFRLEAKESERVAIRAAAERADRDEYLHPQPQSPEGPNRFLVEIETAESKQPSQMPAAFSSWSKEVGAE